LPQAAKPLHWEAVANENQYQYRKGNSLFLSVKWFSTGWTEKMNRGDPDDAARPSQPPAFARPEAGPAGPSAAGAPPVIHSKDLLQGRTEVHIVHYGETYRLTVTRAGKLILHK
jgi:hemin uptake protein HemP